MSEEQYALHAAAKDEEWPAGMPSVVVAFDASPEQRRIVESVLDGDASVEYAHGLSPDQRREVFSRASVVFSGGSRRGITQSEYAYMARVGLLQLISAGANHLPFADIPEPIVIAGNAGAYARPMAEHVMAMILALSKDLLGHNQTLRSGTFDQEPPNRMLTGMTAGIIGFGGIGRSTARLLQNFDVNVLAINSSGKSAKAVGFVGTLDDLECVLRESDIILLTLPLNKRTTGLLGTKELGWMKPDAILINVARGGLIDERALFEHARANPGFLVGLDVWWDEPFPDGVFSTKYPLLELPNVLGSPHNSANVPGIWDEGTRSAALNIKRFLRGDEVTGIVSREDYV